MDLLYSEAMNLIANPSEGEAARAEWRMRAALMVHYLERISDHGVDVGGSAVFLVTGQRIEDACNSTSTGTWTTTVTVRVTEKSFALRAIVI